MFGIIHKHNFTDINILDMRDTDIYFVGIVIIENLSADFLHKQRLVVYHSYV